MGAVKATETPKLNIVTFASCKVLDSSGAPIQLGKLWQKQTILFVFLRHFACVSCRGHAAEVWRDRAKYEAGGAKIVFIGNGSPDFIVKFREDLKLEEAPIYTDPSLASFRAAGFNRGFLAALGPAAIANGLIALAKGHKQGPVDRESGDLWQLGGLAVIRPSGEVAYHYISQVLGDYPPEKDMITSSIPDMKP